MSFFSFLFRDFIRHCGIGRLGLGAACTLSGLAFSAGAWAFGSPGASNSTSTTIPVTTTAVATCHVTAQPLNFPSLLTGTTALTTASSSVEVECAEGLNYQVLVDQGLSAAGTPRLSLSGRMLAYSLAKDSGFTQPWGPGTPFTGVGSGARQVHTFFGRIPAGQAIPAAGVYTDTLLVTVLY